MAKLMTELKSFGNISIRRRLNSASPAVAETIGIESCNTSRVITIESTPSLKASIRWVLKAAPAPRTGWTVAAVAAVDSCTARSPWRDRIRIPPFAERDFELQSHKRLHLDQREGITPICRITPRRSYSVHSVLI